MKNKTSLNLDFDIFINFMSSSQNFYEKYNIGCGVSKIIESTDFQSSIRIALNLYTYKSNDLDFGDGAGWSLQFDYPN